MKNENISNFSTKGGTNQIYLHEPRGDSETYRQRSSPEGQNALFACVLGIILNNVLRQRRNRQAQQAAENCETKIN